MPEPVAQIVAGVEAMYGGATPIIDGVASVHGESSGHTVTSGFWRVCAGSATVHRIPVLPLLLKNEGFVGRS